MVYLFGEFRFDSGQGLLFRGETVVPLKPKSIRVLEILLENHGQMVPKETIMSRVWPDAFVEDNNLSQCIANLRRALDDDRNETQYIQTVVKRGFRFVGQVTIEATSGNIQQEIARPAVQVPALQISPAIASSDRAELSGSQPTAPFASHSPHPWYSRLSTALFVVGLLVLAYYLLANAVAPPTPKVLGFARVTHDGRWKGYTGPLLTNGARLYFPENRGAGVVLASVSTQGGEVAAVSLPTDFFPTDVWPDGSKFIGTEAKTRGKESLAVASATGKSLQWLLQLPVQTGQGRWFAMAAWAPNGHKIAFCYGHDLFEARSDGSEMRRLASLNDWPDWPRWSPDGRVLRFSLLNRKTESTSIWQINADGTHLHALAFPGSAFSVTCCGNWMPNGKYFVFQAKQDGHYDIWALRERSSWPQRSGPRLVRLTSGPLNYFSPLPSRNGKEIFVFGGESRGELMRFDLKTHTFADFLGGISAAEVSFSRDGKWVAYVTYPDYTLWVARADGSNAMQLTFPPLEAREPHWSPNGEQIAFQGISDGPRYKIYLISREGGEPQQVIPGDGEESVATWWPDGHSLIYDEPLFRHDVSQMSIHRLDLRTKKSTVIPGTAGAWTARLSPDGRSIATLDATPTANPQHLYILDSVTGRRKLVVNVPGLSEPTWSQDGRYVYFAEISARLPALYRVRVRDGELERLASLSKFPVAGVWAGVAPDGSPLLLRNTSTQELYALRVRLP